MTTIVENIPQTFKFTTDYYRCGQCHSEYSLLEEFIAHKVLIEKNKIVICTSDKIAGLKIPRFVEGENLAPNNSKINKESEKTPAVKNDKKPSVTKNTERPICNICGSSFINITVLRQHINTVHSDDRPFKCKYAGCTFSFKTKAPLERHRRRHTGERPYPCKFCGRTFRESGTLARHLKSRTPCTSKDNTQYPLYGRNVPLIPKNSEILQIVITKLPENKNVEQTPVNVYFPPMDITVPAKTISETIEIQTISNEEDEETNKNNAINCTVISTNEIKTTEECFPTLNHVVHVENDCLPSEILEQDECEITTTDNNVPLTEDERKELLNEEKNLYMNLAQQLLDQTLECTVCLQVFKQAMALINHIQEDHLAKYLYRCSRCYFVSTDKNSLAIHKKTFSHRKPIHDKIWPRKKEWSEKAIMQLILLTDLIEDQIEKGTCNSDFSNRSQYYRCHICLKKFKYHNYLTLHMYSHTGEEPHTCDLCDKSFICRDSLLKHVVTHSDERNFKCSECGKSFKRSSHMKEHLRTHIKQDTFFCQVCSKGFKWERALKQHELLHNKNVIYECEECGKRFKSKFSIRRHTRRHLIAKISKKKKEIHSNVNLTSESTEDNIPRGDDVLLLIMDDGTLSLIPEPNNVLGGSSSYWRQNQDNPSQNSV